MLKGLLLLFLYLQALFIPRSRSPLIHKSGLVWTRESAENSPSHFTLKFSGSMEESMGSIESILS